MINFAYQNKADSATVTASSAVTSLPASNVQHIWKSRVWRTTGCAGEWIKFNLGSTLGINAFVLTGHNLSSGATVKIQANATDVWTAPSIDQTVTWNADVLVYFWSTAQTYQWWRVTIADAANPAGYLDIGRVYIGPTTSPERNYRTWGREPIDNTVITPSYDGAESFEAKNVYTTLGFQFERILPTEIDALTKAVGMKTYWFVIADYDNLVLADGRHDLTKYVRFDGLPQYSYSHMTRQDIELNLIEAL